MPSALGPLAPGTRLADRFLVVRAVGRGGMGVVYEALDEKLNRRVALKCSAPGHLRRLSPEARAARDISHFHICKVHDVHAVDTPAGTIDVLSMEFIEGETLWDRVTREGPLPADVAYTITRQVCEGLGQAHRQGVIHGDLKGPNVMLGRDPEGQLRAVVTDFGLAQLRFEPDEGERGGTSAYMAPELQRGERPTMASDLYALGVVMHVMLTGRVPGARSAPGVPTPVVDSEQPTHTGERPRVPPIVTRVAEPLPAPWKAIVGRCLRDDPAERPASAEEVERAIEPQRWGLKVAAALAVAAMLALAYRQGAAPVPLGPPVRLAVLPTSGMMSVGVDVAERLTGLRRNFTVITPGEAASNRVDTPEKARRMLGATHALDMQLRLADGALDGNAALIDLESGRNLRQLKGSYAATDPPAIARAFAAMVTEAFRLPIATLEDVLTGDAAVAYADGMGLLRQSGANAAKAMPFFERAVALAPNSARSHAGLAEAQVQQFILDGGPWLDRAAANIAKARTLNADSVSVLIVSGTVAQERGQQEDAIRDLTRAAELEPSNSEAWRRLAISYERSNQPDLASATYQRAIDAQPDYYRHYLSFGNFYFNRGQLDRAELEFRKVTEVAPGLPQGHTNLGLAFMQQGRFVEAERSLLAALSLRPSAGLLLNIGALYYAQERYADALSYFKQSVAAGPPSVVLYANLGDAFRHLGRREEADAAYRQGLALAEDEVTRNPRLASSRVFLGQLAAHLGDRRRAETELSQALALAPENASVLRQAVLAYEVLGLRERSLALLASAPLPLIKELNRQPDVQELRRDARFQDILAGHSAR